MSVVRPLNSYEDGIYSMFVGHAVRVIPELRSVVSLLRPFYKSDMKGYSATDFNYRIYLGDKFFEPEMVMGDGSQIGLTKEQGAYHILHQVMHNLNKHYIRSEATSNGFQTVDVNGDSMKLFKLAGDLEINDMIALGGNGVSSVDVTSAYMSKHFGLDSMLSMEEYISLLHEQASTIKMGSQGNNSQEQGTADDYLGDSTESLHAEDSNNLNNSSFIKDYCDDVTPDLGDSMGLSKPNSADILSATMDFMVLAKESVDKARGNMGLNAMLDRLESINEKSVNNFASELRYAVLSDVPSNKPGKHYTNWTRPKRKQNLSGGILEPSRRAPKAVYYLILDCTGSMLNDDDTRASIRELDSICTEVQHRGHTLHVVTGDTSIGHVEENVTSIEDIIRYGGGGTDMVPIMESAVNDYDADNIILVSDMEIPTGGLAELINANRRRRFLFINTGTMSSYSGEIVSIAESSTNLRLLASKV